MNNTSLAVMPLTPGQDLDSYIQAVSAIPMLSVEEEIELANRYHNDTDLEAAQRLVLSHLRFVTHIARSYKGYGLAQGDLIQEGNIGLMKAVKRFDPSRKVRLVSFAVHWIKAEIHEFILRNWRVVKIATTKAQRKLFFNLRSKKKRLGWMNDAEVNAIAKDLGVSVKDVLQMEARLSYQDNAFDGYDDEDNESAILAPSQYLASNDNNPEEQLEQNTETEGNLVQLHSALAELDERSRDIINKRWLQEDKSTLQELADTYHISAERVRQLEKNAMKKLNISLQ